MAKNKPKTKQGESKTITIHDATDLKDDTVQKDANSIITMRDGKPKRVYFKDGREVAVENV